jgi:hypothetical protein
VRGQEVGELGERVRPAPGLLDLLEQLVHTIVVRGQDVEDVGGGFLPEDAPDDAHAPVKCT